MKREYETNENRRNKRKIEWESGRVGEGEKGSEDRQSSHSPALPLSHSPTLSSVCFVFSLHSLNAASRVGQSFSRVRLPATKMAIPSGFAFCALLQSSESVSLPANIRAADYCEAHRHRRSESRIGISCHRRKRDGPPGEVAA